jgi:hypothetical protein
VHDEFVSNLFTRRKEQAFEFLDSLDQEGFAERMSQEDCAQYLLPCYIRSRLLALKV